MKKNDTDNLWNECGGKLQNEIWIIRTFLPYQF